jgi:hypothetical protein
MREDDDDADNEPVWPTWAVNALFRGARREDGGVWNTHTRMLPRVVKGDHKEGHRSMRLFLKAAYMILPTHCRTGGVLLRIDVGISGCWRIAREGGA